MKTSPALASAAFLAVSLTLATSAFADPRCTDTPQSNWMPQATMLRNLADAGYTMDVFQVTRGSCYEIYGRDKAGAKVEIYFDPVDGKVVKEKRG